MSFAALVEEKLASLRSLHQYRALQTETGLSFSHNDYLGLSQHPALQEAGETAVQIYGAGSTGSRLLGGHSRLFEDAERDIAQYFGVPAALFFSSGYLANLAAVTVLGGLVEQVISDEKIHASLIDGIRLSGLPKIIVPHNGWAGRLALPLGPKNLLVAESLYGMDGDLADAESLLALWNRTDSFLLIDEAHAAGVLRESGQGYFSGRLDFDRAAVVVTFGKAFGVAGAAILCSQAVRELFINSARSFIYTTAPSPVTVAMVRAALQVAQQESWRREELWARSESVRETLSEILVQSPVPDRLWHRRGPVIPVPFPGSDNALRFCESMRDSGVSLRAIRYPTVPKGQERVRISLNLSISRENTESMTKELVRRWKAFSSQGPIQT